MSEEDQWKILNKHIADIAVIKEHFENNGIVCQILGQVTQINGQVRKHDKYINQLKGGFVVMVAVVFPLIGYIFYQLNN